MNTTELPGITIYQHKGISYIKEGIYLKVIDTGVVNSLLERIKDMNYDETADYLRNYQFKILRRIIE